MSDNIVLDNSKVSKHLGQVSEYKDQYDPRLLVAEPRSNNRQHLGIEDHDLPFTGYDIWNAYEVSGLTENGLPVAGIAKIVYPCDSKYIVESKSIKLYFNSFNMFKCGDDDQSVLDFISSRAEHDLSNLLETSVRVHIVPGWTRPTGDCVFNDHKYLTLEKFINTERLYSTKFKTYQEDPSVLKLTENWPKNRGKKPMFYHSSLLKSNCRVTSQPDWGDIYISFIASKTVQPLSLLRYIVSFRDECHFHEEICETVYKRLYDLLNPETLMVTCLYARRGGIDINPARSSDMSILNKRLIDHHVMHVKTAKQ